MSAARASESCLSRPNNHAASLSAAAHGRQQLTCARSQARQGAKHYPHLGSQFRLIPKGLHHSAQGWTAGGKGRAVLPWEERPQHRPTLKGLQPLLFPLILTPCHNRWPRSSCIPSSPPRTAAPTCATLPSATNSTATSAVFSQTTVAGLNDKIPSGFGPVETLAMIYDLRLTRRLAQGLVNRQS